MTNMINKTDVERWAFVRYQHPNDEVQTIKILADRLEKDCDQAGVENPVQWWIDRTIAHLTQVITDPNDPRSRLQNLFPSPRIIDSGIEMIAKETA
jgi:hypothetical protein